MEVSPSVAWGSTGHFHVYGMLPVPLTRSWCAIWFAMSRHGGLDVVGSFYRFLIVFHALRLFCVIFLSSVILSVSLFPDSFEKGC